MLKEKGLILAQGFRGFSLWFLGSLNLVMSVWDERTVVHFWCAGSRKERERLETCFNFRNTGLGLISFRLVLLPTISIISTNSCHQLGSQAFTK